jgi:hypothetical protein
MNIVALSAKDMTGEKKTLDRIARANKSMKVLKKGKRTSPEITTNKERLMIGLCLFVRSANPVRRGRLTSVTNGAIPASSPIWAPVKDRDW